MAEVEGGSTETDTAPKQASSLAMRHQACAIATQIQCFPVLLPFHITPGRRLSKSLPSDDGDIVVMLDADEILISGPLDEVSERIRRVRAEHGWIMDTYLLRLHLDVTEG